MNLADWVLLLALFLLALGAWRSLRRRKSGCGGPCAGCPAHRTCAAARKKGE